MTPEDRIAELEKKLQYLTDRQEIYDCITSTSRGNDRFDKELITGSYHADAVHELGMKQISGADYGDHANQAHGALFAANLHSVTMHRCDIDGDVAHCESYSIGLFLDKDCKTSRVLAGRYLDRLERRDGKWGLVLRRATVEVPLAGSAQLPNGAYMPGSGYLKGSRDRDDPSYQRPLTVEGGDRW